MVLDRNDQILVDALRLHAKGGKRPPFPFDDLKFTLEQAAATIERKQALANLRTVTALRRAESFISGFEGDELQEGIDDLLSEIRAAIKQAEGDAS